MKPPAPPHRRLPGDPAYRRLWVAHRHPWASTSYWLAADHLLVVRVAGVVESYRRIDRADLQLILVQPTAWGRVATVLSAAAVAVSGIGLAAFLVAFRADRDFLPWAPGIAGAWLASLLVLAGSLVHWRSCMVATTNRLFMESGLTS
ncbi:MAG: hypothetical protein ACKOET_10485, partial [Verrucomicrobiota bacterium]